MLNADTMHATLSRRELLSSLGLIPVFGTAAHADAGWHANPIDPQAQPLPMTAVRLLDGPFKDSQALNARFINSIPPDRLLHTFRINAGLPSTAEPLGGWEKPDCELRGHFAGHYLSACSLMYASTGDAAFQAQAAYMVASLAKCQAALGGGYLSAFPLAFFDRLNARQKVWAPFYTIHKIMAGLLDVNQHCANPQALQVLEGMADWTDRWSAPLSDAHMQDVLGTEFGGMAETLYSLAMLTGNARYEATAERFEKRRFLNPLAEGRDELQGLHVNTHVPQVIGAARRYEISQDARYRDIADYFWREVTTRRTYCTGGTSNAEVWKTPPGQLAAELPQSTDTEECCVAYNMLKLTRELYQWTADPRYFDYYERVLFNHRLGTLDRQTGSGMYYLPLHADSWKVFGSNYDSFWCCTGTGAEEHAKFNDSIYFTDSRGVFVNLFIASEAEISGRGLRLTQTTRFPDEPKTTLTVHAHKPVAIALRIRVPHWLAEPATARVNGKAAGVKAERGTYLTLARTWHDGDRVEFDLPMTLRTEALPGDPRTFAFLQGPIVLAGQMGAQDLTRAMSVNGSEPGLHEDPKKFDSLSSDPAALKPIPGQPLTYSAGAVTLCPLHRIFDQRYAVYWREA